MPKTKFFDEKYALGREVLVGHADALSSILEHLEIYAAGLGDNTRPVGSFLLAGPTGCGKTTLARAVAYALHYDSKKLLRVDCGEFQQSHEVAKLLGAPPGYLGHRESPALLGQTRLQLQTSEHSPISVVLFDEIEKAAPEFHDLLLGILDAGRLTLGNNEVTSFASSLILMTSNQGVKDTSTKLKYGFTPTTLSETAKKSIIKASIERFFSPEFRNRLDGILVMNQLSREEVKDVVRHELAAVFDGAPVDVSIDETVLDKITDFGYSEEFGARQVKRIIEQKLVHPVARIILNGVKPNQVVTITTTPTGFLIKTTEREYGQLAVGQNS